jgi:hypothetical protein
MHESYRLRLEQRSGLPLGELISGHKKDLVLSNRLLQFPGRVATMAGTGRPTIPFSRSVPSTEPGTSTTATASASSARPSSSTADPARSTTPAELLPVPRTR